MKTTKKTARKIAPKKAVEKEGVTRKSLMISLDAHKHLMDMANKFEVSQPELVEALIKSADKSRLTAALAEISAAKTRAAEELDAKRTLMEKAMSMSLADLEKRLG